ncbi:MAG: hypothetical protein WCT02_04535, partial [Candidatus Paceibacterota bacterium]
ADGSNIRANETFTRAELLYPLLLNSSNVAAEALASSSDRVKYIEAMARYAWEIGMSSTYFADPTGLSSRNISTARDFFSLAKYLYKNRSDVLSITKTPRYLLSTTTEHGSHVFTSIHPFVNYPGFLGGKTGHTVEARDTMLTILKIDSRPIAIIVLGSDDREKDTQMLIEKVGKMVK